jgi:pilus assembly protein CpaF
MMADKSLLAHFGIKKNNQVNRLMTEELLGDDLLLHTAKNKIIEQIISLKIDQLNQQEINRILNEYKLSKVEKSYLYNIIDAEINNYGPLTELMNNDNVKEILVNGKDDIYAEIDGQIIKQENIYFINDNHIIRLIERLLKSVNKTLNNYIINVKLKNGYKLNAILPPIATNGPILTIKKNIEKTLDIEDMLRSGTLTPYMARFLEAAVLAKLNILICGNVGSGKTSLLNALANLIPVMKEL